MTDSKSPGAPPTAPVAAPAGLAAEGALREALDDLSDLESYMPTVRLADQMHASVTTLRAAFAAPGPRLSQAEREALARLATYVKSLDPREATARYETIASAFYRETHLIAPGSSVPAAMGGYSEEQERERQEKWRPFVNRWHEQANDAARADLATLAPLLETPARSAIPSGNGGGDAA